VFDARLIVLLAACHAPAATNASRKDPMTQWNARHIRITIARSPAEVYAFAVEPSNLPTWASGLAAGIHQVDGAWIASSPIGDVRVAFVPRNELGVLDHDVTLPTGVTVHNPMRVLPNATGSEVVFTLFQLPGVSDAKFGDDERLVAHDLQTLKTVLERDR
jgi:hypothetical protein